LPAERASRRVRLFLALWPDQAIQADIDAHASGWTLPRSCLRYGTQDWHVTLHFLGAVAMERVPELAQAVDLPMDPFQLLLDKPQLWPRGLAVLGATQVPPALRDLHGRLGAAVAAVGLPLEARTYRPHVTLARRAEGAVAPKGPVSVTWPARSFALVVSTGSRDRRYEVLREYRRRAG
jgi:RNA 2',3'-cyclic 3'-phosphodiesterase